jgi:predicted phosphodiesterase
LRLGVIADAHLSPPGTRVSAFHTGYESPYTAAAYRFALRRCIKEGVDGVLLLSDLSHSGDDKSLETGVRLAAAIGRRVWAVSGNHDCFERADALEAAVRRVAEDNIWLVSPPGAVAEGEPRVAGLCVARGRGGYKARSNGSWGAEDWGDEPAV